ncbi:MAG: phosphate ABC transporter ATP-binding protein [Algisphaera sp.]
MANDPTAEPALAPALLRACCVTVRYGGRAVVRDVALDIARGRITAIIGPSGCGKSSFLAALNRLTDLISGCSVSGAAQLEGHDLLGSEVDPVALRRRVGMIFQKPNPFAMSIRKNLEMPLKQNGVKSRSDRRDLAQEALKDVGLWDEVSGRLNQNAMRLSGGQQQRLCIARAVVLRPRMLLLDEPCSALDPMATQCIEELLVNLRGGCCGLNSKTLEPLTQIVVTHNLAQARRIADDTAVFWVREGCGVMIESGSTEQIFTAPQQEETRRYVGGLQG